MVDRAALEENADGAGQTEESEVVYAMEAKGGEAQKTMARAATVQTIVAVVEPELVAAGSGLAWASAAAVAGLKVSSSLVIVQGSAEANGCFRQPIDVEDPSRSRNQSEPGGFFELRPAYPVVWCRETVADFGRDDASRRQAGKAIADGKSFVVGVGVGAAADDDSSFDDSGRVPLWRVKTLN